MIEAKILIVDDDKDDRLVLKDILEEQQYHSALYFENGHAVLAYLDQIKEDSYLPQTIITDINMPVMSGVELLKILKANPRFSSIKVVVLSTGSKEDYRDECHRLGALAYIEKPYTYMEMKKMVTYFTML